MGNRPIKKAQDQARGVCITLIASAMDLIHTKSINVYPSKNRLRIYLDSIDKYYRVRDLKRALPEVVVKVYSTINFF
jgi:DNA-directed RNA polymerase III subunit RPC1